MSDFFESLKKTWVRAIEVVGDTATNLADSAKTKVNEINLSSSRKEIISQCGELAYQLWLDGEALPAKLVEQFEQLKNFDEQLAEIHAQRQAEEDKKAQAQKEREERHSSKEEEQEELKRQTKEVLDGVQANQEPSTDENLDTPVPVKEAAEAPLTDEKAEAAPPQANEEPKTADGLGEGKENSPIE